LAAEITKIHSYVTGAPTSFVHVIFQELPAISVFIDSVPSHPVLINGLIRAGRTDAEKTRLARDISSTGSRIAGIPEARIFVSIDDIPHGSRSRVVGCCLSPAPKTTGPTKQRVDPSKPAWNDDLAQARRPGSRLAVWPRNGRSRRGLRRRTRGIA
jgi:phenylpyruvate tautomerase PptA (4-oxalocrotonate tautomerase family)